MTRCDSRCKTVTKFVAIAIGFITCTGIVPLPTAAAYTGAEQRYLNEVVQYFYLTRPPDPTLLQLGYQACAVRRSGGTSDDAKVSVWNKWDSYGFRAAAGAEIGSLVHVAVDNLCPEVGYP